LKAFPHLAYTLLNVGQGEFAKVKVMLRDAIVGRNGRHLESWEAPVGVFTNPEHFSDFCGCIWLSMKLK